MALGVWRSQPLAQHALQLLCIQTLGVAHTPCWGHAGQCSQSLVGTHRAVLPKPAGRTFRLRDSRAAVL